MDRTTNHKPQTTNHKLQTSSPKGDFFMSHMIKITFNAPGETTKDILIAELSDIGFHGFEESNNDLIGYITGKSLEEKMLEEIIFKHNVQSSREIIAETNWNTLWESNYPPVNIDDYCTIRALFHDEVNSFIHTILITPKMSFGTG